MGEALSEILAAEPSEEDSPQHQPQLMDAKEEQAEQKYRWGMKVEMYVLVFDFGDFLKVWPVEMENEQGKEEDEQGGEKREM